MFYVDVQSVSSVQLVSAKTTDKLKLTVCSFTTVYVDISISLFSQRCALGSG